MKKLSLIGLIILFVIATEIYSQTPVYYSNFPLLLDSLRTPFQKAGIPLISDLDNDGQKEIITVGLDYKSVVNPPVMLYVVKSDGSFFTNFPKGYNELIFDMASGDVDGDGFPDIALRMSNSFDVINRFGSHLDGFPVNYSDGNINSNLFITIYDLDNDGKLEIIVSRSGELSVYNFNGNIKSGWPKPIVGKIKYNPAVGDIDNDGFAEIIFSSFKHINSVIDSGAVNIIRFNGMNFSRNWPVYFDSLYFSWSASPSLFLNKNNSDSTFFIVPLDKYSVSTERLHKFILFDIHGNIIKYSYQLTVHDYGTFVMGDLDGDNNVDYSSGTQYGNTLSAFDNNLILNKFWPAWGNGEEYATSVICKLSNNDQMNIISNRWSAEEGTGNGYIYVYNLNAVNLPWSPLRPHGISKSISICDLNNDGSVELITTTLAREGFFLYAWTIPGIPFTHNNFPWPMYGHDRYRTNQYGFIPPDEPVGILPSSAIVPEKFSLMQNYPNPFNPITTIRFDIRISAFTKLTIFDALGREIETLVDENLSPGSYSLVFDGSKFTSGVYFYRLTSENFTETKRMLMIK